MKCPSCGAEIGSSKFCEFCGTQISYEMRREQEQLSKKGCPKCGSSNIQFQREKQGEIHGKRTQQVIRRTVGFCKDCGATWYPNADTELPKKRRTWLWVLGWLFIFPVPLTILMLRNEKLKPAIKYGIIAIAWIAYFLIATSNKTSNNAETTPIQTQSVTITETDQKPVLNVEIEVIPNVNSEDGTVLFGITTNLPESTELLVTVKGDNEYTAQDKTVILKDGTGYTAEFSNHGEGLKGKYCVIVTMSLPMLQSDTVRNTIGEKGEHITGPYVIKSEIDGSNTVHGEFEFEF